MSDVAGVVLAALVLLPSWAAAAQDDPLEQARAAIRAGDPARAIAILEQARTTSTDPGLDYELYVAYELAGDPARAADHLEAYLDAEPDLGPAERSNLAGHLRDLRAGPRPTGVQGSDPALRTAGWALLVPGIVGFLTFLGSGGLALALESSLESECRADASRCAPGARAPLEAATIVAFVGLGVGIPLGAAGAILLAIAGAEEGSSRSLPPDLDPSLQRPFSLRSSFGPEGVSATLEVPF